MTPDILAQIDAVATTENDWVVGFDAYCNGVPRDELTTPRQHQGWMAALYAQADAETDDYLEHQRDVDWLRYGL